MHPAAFTQIWLYNFVDQGIAEDNYTVPLGTLLLFTVLIGKAFAGCDCKRAISLPFLATWISGSLPRLPSIKVLLIVPVIIFLLLIG